MPKPEKTVTKMTVDFTTASERRQGGAKAAHVDAGDVLLKLKSASFSKVKEGSKNEGQPIVVWIWEVIKPNSAAKQAAGKVIYYRTGCWPEAVFAFRNVLQDLLGGKDIPGKAMNVD